MRDALTFTRVRIWNGVDFEDGTVTVEGARITALHGEVLGREMPCEGLHVFPALIDNHVHFREPGAEAKEDFGTGSRAAAHGGVGTVLEVQNSPPLLTTPELARAKRKLVDAKCLIHAGFYASAVPATLPHLNAIKDLTAGLKLFMAPSHGDGGLSGEEAMRPFFSAAAEKGILLIVHAEDGAVVARETKKYGHLGPAWFSRCRPPRAELDAVELALRLAGECGTRLHVFHVTSAGSVDLIIAAREQGVDVSASTCPHYLFFTDRDLTEKEGLLKVNPAIKGPPDRARLLEAVRGGEIEIVSTDHAPHLPEEKRRPFDRVPAGISSADFVLPLMSTLVKRGELSWPDVYRLCVTEPARIHGLLSATRIAPGEAADLVFFNPDAVWTAGEEDLLSRAKCSPYLGMELTGKVAATLVAGRAAYADPAGPLVGLLAS